MQNKFLKNSILFFWNNSKTNNHRTMKLITLEFSMNGDYFEIF